MHLPMACCLASSDRGPNAPQHQAGSCLPLLQDTRPRRQLAPGSSSGSRQSQGGANSLWKMQLDKWQLQRLCRNQGKCRKINPCSAPTSSLGGEQRKAIVSLNYSSTNRSKVMDGVVFPGQGLRPGAADCMWGGLAPAGGGHKPVFALYHDIISMIQHFF